MLLPGCTELHGTRASPHSSVAPQPASKDCCAVRVHNSGGLRTASKERCAGNGTEKQVLSDHTEMQATIVSVHSSSAVRPAPEEHSIHGLAAHVLRTTATSEDDPSKLKHRFTWTENQCENLLRAQLRTVDLLAYDLSVRPCLFIIKKFRPLFLNVYIQQRSKCSTITLLVFILLWTLVIPSAVAHSLAPYECFEYPARMSQVSFFNESDSITNTVSVIKGELVFERSDCEVFAFFLDWLRMLLPGGCMLLFVIVAYLILERPRYHVLNTKIAGSIKPLMPDIYMCGLGSSSSRNSAWSIMKNAGVPEAYSFVHDYFGSAERARLVFLVGVANALGCTASGFCLSLQKDFLKDQGYEAPIQERVTNIVLSTVTGALAGFAVMRITFSAMNSVLGPSSFFIKIIENELKVHQPHQHVMGGGTEAVVDQGKLKGAVESAIQWVSSRSHLAEQDAADMRKLIDDIYHNGVQLLETVAVWLMKYQHELRTCNGPCFELFKSMDSFSCTEPELAALTFLDVKLFLINFFDESWDISDQNHKFSGKVNDLVQDFFPVMKQVYISYPEAKICTQSRAGFWQIDEVHFDSRKVRDASFFRYGEYSLHDEDSLDAQYKRAMSRQL